MRTRWAVAIGMTILATLLLPAPVAAATLPTAPRAVATTAGAGSATVVWRAPASSGGVAVDRYRVVRTTSGRPAVTVDLGAGRRSLTVRNLEPGRTYSFRVRAHNGRGWSAFSRTAKVRPNARAGFGTLTGACRVVAPRIGATTPSLSGSRHLDFGTDPYDDPADRPRLTPGGRRVLTQIGGGGSSLYSEVFGFEALARCESATLLKTEDEIQYETVGATADLLVRIAGHKVGVGIMRAVAFPLGTPYPLGTAQSLLTNALDDIDQASQDVAAVDEWVKSVLVVVAYDQQHADTIATAWAGLSDTTKDDTVVYVVTTDGDDTFLYTAG